MMVVFAEFAGNNVVKTVEKLPCLQEFVLKLMSKVFVSRYFFKNLREVNRKFVFAFCN